MALNFNVLPKFDRLTALYRHRKSIDVSLGSTPEESLDSHRLVNQMSMSLTTKGLLNPTGENNCFLNSAVQVLWHIAVFRRSFREIEGHYCIGQSCIFCSLKSLFSDFQHDTGQSAIPPDELRQALALCFQGQHRFQLGLMDDAAECFEKLLERIHYHLTGSENMDTCSTDYCIPHQKFALTILERTECQCSATSEPLSFVQFVHYISSSVFSKEAKKVKDQPPTSAAHCTFSRIVNAAGSFGETRQCTNYAHCKQTVTVKRILLNSPDVFSLGLIWDSASPSVDDIMAVVDNIGLSLQLNEVFDHVFSDAAQSNQLELTAVVAYYGRHYSTFCFHSKRNEWIYFDDAKFRTIGPDWSEVVELIRKAHYQPLLLVYTNRFGETVDMAGAPTEVVLTSEISNTLPTLQEAPEETPEEIELTNQITNEKSTSDNSVGTMISDRPSINPMTLSILPAGLAVQHSQLSTLSQGVSSTSEDLMMFSLSPAVTSKPATSKMTTFSNSSTPSHPHPLQQHPVTPLSSQAHSVTPSQPTMSQAHRVTPSELPHVTSPQPHTSAQSQESTIRPRPRSQNTPTEKQPKFQTNPKSEVVIEESKVHAQQHNFQTEDDLITFSISPVAMATNRTHMNVPTSNTSRGESEVTQSENEDLMKFSLSQKDLARLQRKQIHTTPISRVVTQGSSTNSFATKSHDSHMTSDLSPKWDHFARPQVTATWGQGSVASNDELWAVLSINRPEQLLHSNGLPVESSQEALSVSKTDTPAVKSLKRMASIPDHHSTGISPTLPGKPPLHSGTVPQVSVSTTIKGQGISPVTKRQDFSKRKLPEIPTSSGSPSTSDQTGTYAELDFHDRLHSQQSSTVQVTKEKDSRSEYAQVQLPEKKIGRGGHVTRETTPPRAHVTKEFQSVNKQTTGHNAASAVSPSNPDNLIGEDPLYAVPDHVIRRLRATDNQIDALPRWVQSDLSEARDLLAKAQAIRGSDDTVAMMLLTQYKSLLDKILRDPVVLSRAMLSRQIRAKREEGAQLFNQLQLQRVNQQPPVKVRDKCSKCGHERDLDPRLRLCGPCELRVRIAN